MIPAELFYFLLLANSRIYTTYLRDTSENWIMGGIENLMYENLVVSILAIELENFPKCKKVMAQRLALNGLGYCMSYTYFT
jgi:hypothetical protein